MAAAPWIVSDDLWELVRPLLPKKERRFRYPGRRRLPERKHDGAPGRLVAVGPADEQPFELVRAHRRWHFRWVVERVLSGRGRGRRGITSSVAVPSPAMRAPRTITTGNPSALVARTRSAAAASSSATAICVVRSGRPARSEGSAEVAERRQAGDADRDVGRAAAERAPERVRDDHRDVDAGPLADRGRGSGVRSRRGRAGAAPPCPARARSSGRRRPRRRRSRGASRRSRAPPRERTMRAVSRRITSSCAEVGLGPASSRARSEGSTSSRRTTRPSAFETAFCATTTTSPSSSSAAADDQRAEVVALPDLGQALDREDLDHARSMPVTRIPACAGSAGSGSRSPRSAPRACVRSRAGRRRARGRRRASPASASASSFARGVVAADERVLVRRRLVEVRRGDRVEARRRPGPRRGPGSARRASARPGRAARRPREREVARDGEERRLAERGRRPRGRCRARPSAFTASTARSAPRDGLARSSRPRRAGPSSAAAARARAASREPITTSSSPSATSRAASARPKLPVPPRIATLMRAHAAASSTACASRRRASSSVISVRVTTGADRRPAARAGASCSSMHERVDQPRVAAGDGAGAGPAGEAGEHAVGGALDGPAADERADRDARHAALARARRGSRRPRGSARSRRTGCSARSRSRRRRRSPRARRAPAVASGAPV